MHRQRGRRAEEVAIESLARPVYLGAAGQGLFLGPAFELSHASDPPGARCDQSKMECILAVAHQLIRATPDQDHVALGHRPVNDLFQAMNVPVVRRVKPEPVGDTDRLLIQRLELGIRNVLDCRRLVHQFPVEQGPADVFRQSLGDLRASGTVLPRYSDQSHGHLSARSNKKPRAEA